MSSGNIAITYEDLIEKSQNHISDLEFDISNVIIPYSEFLKSPIKKSNIETDSYIKIILEKELQ